MQISNMFLLHAHPPHSLAELPGVSLFSGLLGSCRFYCCIFLLVKSTTTYLFCFFSCRILCCHLLLVLIRFCSFDFSIIITVWELREDEGTMCVHIYMKEVTYMQLVIFTCKPDRWFSCHFCIGHLYN